MAWLYPTFRQKTVTGYAVHYDIAGRYQHGTQLKSTADKQNRFETDVSTELINLLSGEGTNTRRYNN
jgi:hypothetical protein